MYTHNLIEQGGTFTDPKDGKTYKTVTIGKQTRMAENLNYNADGSKCYDNNPAYAQKYGRLYNWETAKKACPPGWHLPSNVEWQILVDFVGGDEVAGKNLKASSGWNNCRDKKFIEKSGNGEDTYDFAALPGGRGFPDGSFGGGIGYNGIWWSSSGDNANSYYWCISYAKESVVRKSEESKDNYFSVRCVKINCNCLNQNSQKEFPE